MTSWLRYLGPRLLGLALILATSAVHAKDSCIDFVGTGADVIDVVGEGFKVPKAGKCGPFIGVRNASYVGQVS